MSRDTSKASNDSSQDENTTALSILDCSISLIEEVTEFVEVEMGKINHRIHLNVDLGEGYGNLICGPDEDLIPMIDHANVACGFQ